MKHVIVAAPAKVNLYLEVTGRDGAGYHLLETIFATLELHDEVEVGLSDQPGVRLRCSDPALPTGAANLAHQAASAYLAAHPLGGVEITLTKRIPAGGGLGGGSSDAAAVLRALARLDPNPLAPTELATIAAQLGSDVPFFLVGGCAHATGRGEVLTPLPDLPPQTLSLVLPDLHCSTPTVFKALSADERGPRQALGSEHWASQLSTAFPNYLHNRLQAAAARAYPALAAVYAACASSGQPWLVSGSGATCFVLGDIDPPTGCRVVTTTLRRRQDLDQVIV